MNDRDLRKENFGAHRMPLAQLLHAGTRSQVGFNWNRWAAVVPVIQTVSFRALNNLYLMPFKSQNQEMKQTGGVFKIPRYIIIWFSVVTTLNLSTLSGCLGRDFHSVKTNRVDCLFFSHASPKKIPFTFLTVAFVKHTFNRPLYFGVQVPRLPSQSAKRPLLPSAHPTSEPPSKVCWRIQL